jgi:hypothetical protein
MHMSRPRSAWVACAVLAVAGSLVSLLWTDPARSGTAVGLEGYRCYKAKTAKGTPKPEPQLVGLVGNLQTTLAMAIKPVMLCDPLSPINATALPPLVCYAVKDVKGTPKFEGIRVNVTTMLGEHVLDVGGSKTACIPALLP